MTDYSYTAAGDVNLYIWSKLLDSGVLSAADYVNPMVGEAVIPFIPAQEDPVFTNLVGDSPYIVFDVMTTANSTSSPDAWWVERDELTYAIYGPDLDKLDQIVNVIKNSCRKFDDSARQINATAGISGKYHFQTINVEWAERADASRSEAGRASQLIQVCYNYIRFEDESGDYL